MDSNNIHSQLKKIAKAWQASGIFTFVIGILLCFVEGGEFIGYAVLCLIGGCICGGPLSHTMFGLGELIERVGNIERNTRGNTQMSSVAINEANARIDELDRLRAQNLITEEEYQQALSAKQEN